MYLQGSKQIQWKGLIPATFKYEQFYTIRNEPVLVGFAPYFSSNQTGVRRVDSEKKTS